MQHKPQTFRERAEQRLQDEAMGSAGLAFWMFRATKDA